MQSKKNSRYLLTTQEWFDFLHKSQMLSERYAHRYAVLFSTFTQNSDKETISKVYSIARKNPLKALRQLLCCEEAPSISNEENTWHISQAGSNADLVKKWCDSGLDKYLLSQPIYQQTWVPLHPDRHVKAIDASEEEQLVAVRWSTSSVASRRNNEEQFKEITKSVSTNSSVPVTVWDDYTICEAGLQYVWTITNNLGPTLEDLLRSGELDPGTRRTVIDALVALRTEMISTGVVWQGFAPRNMFIKNGALVLIDFEEIADTQTSPFAASEFLLWHRIFFADVLSPAEFEELFEHESDWTDARDNKKELFSADAFEQAQTGKEQIAWSDRCRLLKESERIERSHLRPYFSSRGKLLFGHELGHFWGDFIDPKVEASIFTELIKLNDTTLVKVLEILEVAMEADILRQMWHDAAARTTTTTPYTDAIAETFTTDINSAIEIRDSIADQWDARFQNDPRILASDILFELTSSDDLLVKEALLGIAGDSERTTSELSNALQIGVDFLHKHERGEPILRYLEPAALAALVSQPLPEQGLEFADLMTETKQKVVDYSILQSHPGYLAFPDSANASATLAGGVLSKLLNQNLIAVDRSAPAATFVEIQTIAWLRELAGYQVKPMTEMLGVKDVGGLWTTGGHLSNHIAMLTAIGSTFPNIPTEGIRSLEDSPAVVLAGSIAHYSHADAAFHLGLGWNSILKVNATDHYTTDPSAVDAVLSNPPRGKKPFMVVGVAGNCRTTGLDDLVQIGEVCRRHGVWFHVDACHGGSLIFSKRLRNKHLRGLELADSISLDPHKGLFTPYPSSFIIFRDPQTLTQFSRHTEEVLLDNCWDLGLIMPFLGSRGFESLGTWLMMKHLGVQGLGQLVEQRQGLVRHLGFRLDESSLFLALNDIDFYRLTFVLCPPEAHKYISQLSGKAKERAREVVSAFTSKLNTALYREGIVCFDEHTLADLDNRVGTDSSGSFKVMAACPGSPSINQSEIEDAVTHLIETARPISHELMETLKKETSPIPSSPHSGPAGWSD